MWLRAAHTAATAWTRITKELQRLQEHWVLQHDWQLTGRMNEECDYVIVWTNAVNKVSQGVDKSISQL